MTSEPDDTTTFDRSPPDPAGPDVEPVTTIRTRLWETACDPVTSVGNLYRPSNVHEPDVNRPSEGSSETLTRLPGVWTNDPLIAGSPGSTRLPDRKGDLRNGLDACTPCASTSSWSATAAIDPLKSRSVVTSERLSRASSSTRNLGPPNSRILNPLPSGSTPIDRSNDLMLYNVPFERMMSPMLVSILRHIWF